MIKVLDHSLGAAALGLAGPVSAYFGRPGAGLKLPALTCVPIRRRDTHMWRVAVKSSRWLAVHHPVDEAGDSHIHRVSHWVTGAPFARGFTVLKLVYLIAIKQVGYWAEVSGCSLPIYR